MSKIQCIRHPRYKITETPDLSCQVCCSLYMDAIQNELLEKEELSLTLNKNKANQGHAKYAEQKNHGLKRDFFVEI